MERIAAVQSLDLAGKKVTVQDENGKSAQVDARAAVKILRERVESLRRLVDCLGGGR
jgi:hypothetical protein